MSWTPVVAVAAAAAAAVVAACTVHRRAPTNTSLELEQSPMMLTIFYSY